MSIFKEDNVFSITASLPYGPPVNTDIDYYRTFFGLASFSRIRDLRVFHVYVTWEAYIDGRSRSLKAIYSPPRTFHSDRLFLSIMTTDI